MLSNIRRSCCTLVLVCSYCAAQSAVSPHFEVASIRRVDHSARFSYAGPETGDPGRIIWSRVSVRELIQAAYRDAYTEYAGYPVLISGPPSIDDDYSVTATIPSGRTSKDISRMFQNLVTERFGLKFHDENKDVQGFELVVGERGFKLTPSTADVGSTPSNSGTPVKPSGPDRDRQGFPILTSEDRWRSSFDHQLGVIRVSFRQCSMKSLANMLSLTYAGNSVPVVDKTEIKGLFDYHLVLPIPSFTILPPGLAARMPPQSAPDGPGVDLRAISGSLEKQTGLRLKAVKLTLRTMVIDRVARTPTEN